MYTLAALTSSGYSHGSAIARPTHWSIGAVPWSSDGLLKRVIIGFDLGGDSDFGLAMRHVRANLDEVGGLAPDNTRGL